MKAVHYQLSEPSLKPEPILLAGQSGSGKTVALCDLAFRIRKEGWPVIFLGRQYSQLDFTRVGDACEWLENLGASAVLVIWDALQSPSDYGALANSMAQRGRKVLVVGSTYRVKEELTKRFECFEFRTKIDKDEKARFLAHLASIDRSIAKEQLPWLDDVEDNFFVAIYHLLPTARSNLKLGLHGEHDRGLRELHDAQGKTGPANADSQLWFSKLLRETAGDRWQSLWEADKDPQAKADADRDRLLKLSRLVLVPGQFGEDVPIDLLLRCMPDGFALLRSDAFRDTGIFVWSEDPDGNPLIGVRSSKEAELLCHGDLLTIDQETQTLHDLITNIRPGDWERSNREIVFATRLLKQIEPGGPFAFRFKKRLDKLVGMLSDWRKQWNRIHPELVIREANLRREWLRQRTDALRDASQPSDSHDYLDEFRKGRALIWQALELASRISHSNKAHKKVVSHLQTELASLYGTAQEFYLTLLSTSQHSGERATWRDELEGTYGEAMEQAKLAVATDPLNARPADVRFWVARNRYRSDEENLPEERRAELLADMYDALEENTWLSECEQLQKRLVELGDVLKDEKMSQQAMQALENMGSFTGHYLSAVSRIYDRKHVFRDRPSLIAALEQLDRVPNALEDLRILRLYLRVWWELHGNPKLFTGERIGAALSRTQWQFLSSLLVRRLHHPEEEGNAYARFLYAWCLFQVEDYNRSTEEFRALERLGMGGKHRVIQLATWCDDAGEPIPCTGTIRRLYDEDQRGFVYCSQIRAQIPFQTKLFLEQRLQRDAPLLDFHIAFNFRGAIADPARHYRRSQASRGGS
jgi:hypothetical protein